MEIRPRLHEVCVISHLAFPGLRVFGEAGFLCDSTIYNSSSRSIYRNPVLLMPNCDDDSYDVRFFHLKCILLDTLRFSSSSKASVLLRSSMKILVIILQCGQSLTRKSINIYPTLPLRCLFIRKVSKKLCKSPLFITRCRLQARWQTREV